nr:hypothetical protein [Halovivax sp.]
MGDVSHVHPHERRTAGRLFHRGPMVAADGGERDAVSDSDTPPGRRMRDVDHTPRDGESANRVFERGDEHRGEDVVAAEDDTEGDDDER